MRHHHHFRIVWIALIYLFTFNGFLSAQHPENRPDQTVYIDDAGVIKWVENEEEIQGFGVNYTVPFAHAYRSANKLGIDIYRAIDHDVYHFSRLGFDLYRIHVWDTEISDTLGNILENDHVKAFDYLLSKLQERKINYILTPIAFWGNGWPERDENTPGFSHKYGKGDCLTNPEAIKAQENYLEQFLKHKNQYTGESYLNDPYLIAVEISNEPHHRGKDEDVRAYVAKMIRAVKKSGFKNPVLYNFSHGINYVDQYIQAGAEGGTFQWYPTGLGYQKEIPGNFLPNVDKYEIPFDSILKANGIARTVYEFDAADINKSYMYPAMARSFRTAGIQLATHFSYDPTFLAQMNTEYNTHYMNLAYAPHKALALMISSKIFHTVPLYDKFCEYPFNNGFWDYTIEPLTDVAMCNSEESYIHTNSTEQESWDPSLLKHIAGHGDSPYIKYDGTGAFFLDRLKQGVWRLEVMPDVLLVSNPFGRNSLQRKIAFIQWNDRDMKINLDDLGKNFTIEGINPDNSSNTTSTDGNFSIRPGTYLLVKKGTVNNFKPTDQNDHYRLDEFYAPQSNIDDIYVLHDSPEVLTKGQPFLLKADVICHEEIQSVEVYFSGEFRGKNYPMTKGKGFSYTAEIPAKAINKGMVQYNIVVKTNSGPSTFPGNVKGASFDWDFNRNDIYRIPVLDVSDNYNLFNPADDWRGLRYSFWPDNIGLIPLDNDGNQILEINLNQLHKKDDENPKGPVIEDYTLRYFLNDQIKKDSSLFKDKTRLLFELALKGSGPVQVQLALVDNLGASFGRSITLNKQLSTIEIPLDELKPVPTVIMPRPYPTFLPYYFEHNMEHSLNLKEISGIQLSIGPGLVLDSLEFPILFQIGKIWFE